MNKKKRISIDSTIGGNGDIWMRLVSFYAIVGIKPDLCIEIKIPLFLRNLAQYTFGDRLIILDDDSSVEFHFTCLGIRDLLKGICSNKKYIAPYHRSVIHDKRNREFKDKCNIAMFNIADFLGVIQVPDWAFIEKYQGYLDIIGIKKLRHISYEQYEKQLHLDYNHIYSKLNNTIPVSPELQIPKDFKQEVLVFPTGTSRQFIPVWWAKKYLPNAYYAFFHKDKDALEFSNNGLNVVFFYKEPGDIIALSQNAKWTVSTDSFPSHLLQFATEKCTITITEVLKSRIIAPVFKGVVINAKAVCHPCIHLERKGNPLCMGGYTECINWKNDMYSTEIINSIPK